MSHACHLHGIDTISSAFSTSLESIYNVVGRRSLIRRGRYTGAIYPPDPALNLISPGPRNPDSSEYTANLEQKLQTFPVLNALRKRQDADECGMKLVHISTIQRKEG